MPLEGGSPSLGYRTQQFIQTGQPVYNVKEGPYQAKGDGSDDFAAITAAIAQAHADGPGSGRIGNVVFFPPGLYGVSQTLIVPEGVTLQGCGRVTSIIQARVGGTFTNNAIVQLGNPPTETLTFGSRIIDMAIDCNSVANSIGIRSTNINELAAVINCEIYNYMAAGIQIRTSAAQNYTLRDLYLLLSASAGNGVAYGIDIDGGGSPFRGVDGCTVDSLGAVNTHIAAIRVNNTSGFELCRFHVENCTDGIVIGDTGSCGSFAIDGVTGSTPITSVVRITAAQSFRVNGCVILSGATNSIVDTPRSVTITDAQAATYEVGNGTNNPSVNLSDASGALSTFRAGFFKDDLFVGAPGHNTGTSRIKHGSFTLVAGTKVVSEADVTLNSRIFVMCQTPGGTPGFLQVSARSAGVSFTVLSSSGTDTSVCAYFIFEP